MDVSYINVAGTFLYLCSLLDGCSRSIVHWEIRERMTEADVETIVQRARERYPDARTRILSDKGPQSAIGYVTPADQLAGRAPAIFVQRDRKQETARERKQKARAAPPAHGMTALTA